MSIGRPWTDLPRQLMLTTVMGILFVCQAVYRSFLLICLVYPASTMYLQVKRTIWNPTVFVCVRGSTESCLVPFMVFALMLHLQFERKKWAELSARINCHSVVSPQNAQSARTFRLEHDVHASYELWLFVNYSWFGWRMKCYHLLCRVSQWLGSITWIGIRRSFISSSWMLSNKMQMSLSHELWYRREQSSFVERTEVALLHVLCVLCISLFSGFSHIFLSQVLSLSGVENISACQNTNTADVYFQALSIHGYSYYLSSC